MNVKSLPQVFALGALLVLMVVGGCGRDKSSAPADFSKDPVVFLDEFGSYVIYHAFLGSDVNALDKDITEAYAGSASLSVVVPDSGDPAGSYAGGAFVADIPRDLSGFNALTFWAKASREATLDVVGIGNDNTGTSRYIAEMRALPLTTSWTKFTIPIPLPEKLGAEQGLFYFAEGPEGGVGCEIWLDEIQFENLGTVTNPSADLGSPTISINVGEVDTLGSFPATYNVNGTPHTVSAAAGYFTFTSSNTGVVSVAESGIITGITEGTAELTAALGTVNASGKITVNVSGPEPVPATAAPTPTEPAANVISLFSDAYTDVTVETWSAEWDMADVSDEIVASDSVKKYTDLAYAGIQFASPPVDATSMNVFHMDIWIPSSSSGLEFKVKLVDFGANGVFGGGDDNEHELTFTRNTSPALASQNWVSLDVPLAAFSGLLSRKHVAQLIISANFPTVYVDNIYFYDAGELTAPLYPAPSPSKDPGSVISLLSDVYTDVPIDTWSAVWDNATVENFSIGSDTMKKYTNFRYAGIEFITTTIDASAMTHFHMDVWTPDPTSSPAQFKVKFVDFGPNGVSDGGGGDDSDHELVFDHTTMSTGIWISIDVPMDEFVNLASRGHLAQLVISGDPNTVYIDNIYFYDSGIPLAPPDPAPTPSHTPSDVISLFSDTYTDETVDTWSAVWDTADVSDYVIGTDTTKKYRNLLFAGIEFTSSTIDASAMNHFHMDVWTPDPTAEPAVFRIKLVDFGANGAWDDGGGDDVEHEITLDHNTMNTGSWVSIDVPLADFVNLTTRGHLAQMIISGDPNTLFVDNVYFHK